ncbi:3-mercaptopyruvate sulfurtransferase SseA, contains two rhodanese domains [Alkalispirochaeta americana]|uniref:3-mercaptopyruvate sulfurtransferase SseA, contains two rhodanese domains n=1 Tax=Alkalispirochaeta americana TaxID=159291 RepID=A0A1N6RWP8_9SPIO|nr:rhodanese-like domain-containing protein [Alkalispirochaeta americana]SIQ33285.1 3-mercaptopyruvate sulfurtransferase SseA, contains two rhodanese domains [Alkalispirochaeta americana]
MKKNMVLLMLLAGTLLLASCGGKEEAATTAPAAEAPATVSLQDFAAGYLAGLPENRSYIVSMDDFVNDVRSGKDMYIVDIRRADDYAKGHARGAVNVPWGTSAMWESIPYLPQDRTVYVHCYSGQTAGQAIVMMRLAGIQAVSVNSGWNLGIARVEGYEDILETTENSLGTARHDVHPQVMEMIQNHYQEMAQQVGTPFANFFISEENAKAILDAGDESAQFLSVRRADDYAAGHIETAINVPFNPSMAEMISMLPADKKLVVYCYSGQQSNQVVGLLRLLGYDAVSLIYGMGTPRTAPRGWVNNGYPVVTAN